MKELKIYCDKCGRPFAPEDGGVYIEDIDFCPECWPKAVDTLREWIHAPVEEKEESV